MTVWSRAVPTEPGDYFVRVCWGDFDFPSIARVAPGGFTEAILPIAGLRDEDSAGIWWGPRIEPPPWLASH